MPVVRAIYPKEYPLEFSEDQKVVMREILEDMEECRKSHCPPQPLRCPTCGSPRMIEFADTWGEGAYPEILGKIHVMKALLGEGDLVIDHT